MQLAIWKTLKEAYAITLKDLSAYGGFPFYGIVVLMLMLPGSSLAVPVLLSLIAVTLVVSAIRLLYFKSRPGQPKRKYKTIYERIDNSSFPSIHAARAVMLSMFFYSLSPVLWPVYALLTLIVLLSRLHFRRHDLVDLAAGLIIGIALGYFFF